MVADITSVMGQVQQDAEEGIKWNCVLNSGFIPQTQKIR